MKYISRKYINLGIILVMLSVIALVIGIIKWHFFIISAILISSYIILDLKRLRCPNCGTFENLERLFYARKINIIANIVGRK